MSQCSIYLDYQAMLADAHLDMVSICTWPHLHQPMVLACALTATEIIFAIYASSRRRARIDLPLMISDHPLVSMVEAGDLRPAPAM